MSNEILDLINKAKAEARSDTITRFFGKHSKLILRLLIAFGVIAVIYIGYAVYQKSAEEKFSAILHQSLISQQLGEMEKAKSQLKEIVESSLAPSGVKAIASLRYAAFLIDEGKKSEAEKVYLEVNKCRSCDDYASDLAGLLLVRLWALDEVEVQKPDFIERIEDVEDRATTLKNHIAEQRALVEIRKNNLAEAYEIFAEISKDKDSSQMLKARAADGMKMVESKGFTAKKSEAKTEDKKEVKTEENK